MYHSRFLASSPEIDRIDFAALQGVGGRGLLNGGGGGEGDDHNVTGPVATPSCSRTIPCSPRNSTSSPQAVSSKGAWASRTVRHSGADAARSMSHLHEGVSIPPTHTPHGAVGLTHLYDTTEPSRGNHLSNGGGGPDPTPDAAVLSRRTLSPQADTDVAKAGAAPPVALLRHSHGGTTRILYADGHVETIVTGAVSSNPSCGTAKSATTTPAPPPPQHQHRQQQQAGASAAFAGHAVHASGSGSQLTSPRSRSRSRSRSPTSSSKAGLPRGNASSTGSTAAGAVGEVKRPWLLKSFEAVAQAPQVPPPPLPPPSDPSMIPQWGRPPSLQTPMTPFSVTGTISGFASPTETDGDQRVSRFQSASTHNIPATRAPSRVCVAHVPPPQGGASLATPLPTSAHTSASRHRVTDDCTRASTADASDNTAAFLTGIPVGAWGVSPSMGMAGHRQQRSAENASSHGGGSGRRRGSLVPGSALPVVMRTSPQFETPLNAAAGSGNASTGFDKVATQVLMTMQCGIRAEMAAKQRAAAQTYASRFSRDVSSSPSIFSLRFPFRPLSELHNFATRAEGDVEAAAAAWAALGICHTSPPADNPSAGPLGGGGGAMPRNLNASSPSLSTVAAAMAAMQASANAQATAATAALSPHAMEVLLADAQTTTPSGFTIPELLQDRLLPREAPGMRHKLCELCGVSGLVDSSDTTACRFAVSFVWFALLRCRKAHREQSLVDGYRRLSRAFSDAFPHVAMADTLPPLDVLEELLVELHTCVRYSAQVKSATADAARLDCATSGGGANVSRRTAGTAESHNNTAANASLATQPPTLSASAMRTSNNNNSRTLDVVVGGASAAPAPVPLRLRLQDHSACFSLLLTPTWAKLVNPASTSMPSTGDYRATPADAALSHPRPASEQPSSSLQLARSDEQGVLPSAESLETLVKVYHDLWLHNSEYVQLCLYEELLYKQLALLFGSFIMRLHQAGPPTGAPTPPPGGGLFSPSTSMTMHTASSLPTARSSGATSAGAGMTPATTAAAAAAAGEPPAAAAATHDAGGDALPRPLGSVSMAPISPKRHATTSSNPSPPAAATAIASPAAFTTPVVKDGILDSLIILVAHATFYNCTFCFPNDVYAGLFDDEFRSDVVRWLSFCCHGVVLTHVQVRHWPTPAKTDYAAAQLKRKVAVERELAALGLLHQQQQQSVQHRSHGAARTPVASLAPSSTTYTAVGDGDNGNAVVELDGDDATFEVGDVAANSEARLAYQLDRYGRSAALHVADLARCMARLQRRHQMTAGPTQSALRGRRPGSFRTPISSRRSSVASTSNAPLPATDLSAAVGGHRGSSTPAASATRTKRNESTLTAAPSPTLQRLTPSPSQVGRSRTETGTGGALSLAPRIVGGSVDGLDTSTVVTESTLGPGVLLGIRSSSSSSCAAAAGGGGARAAPGRRSPSNRISMSGVTSVSAGTASASQYRPRRGRVPGSGGAAAAAAMAQARLAQEQEEARAQYRTSAAAPVDKSLVFLAAELRGAGASGMGGQHVHHPAAPSVGGTSSSADGVDGAMGAVEGELPSSVPQPRRRVSLDAHDDQRRGGRHQRQPTSLLASYPLCCSPAPILEYWLSTLIRAPCWWTTRTGVATATAVAGAAAATSPAAMQQQSAQLVLWSSVPVGADGEVVPVSDLCRLQLEPWRSIFQPIVVVPPISDEAQQAAQRIRIYARTLPRQQLRLYKLVELQFVQREQRDLFQAYQTPQIAHTHAQWRLHDVNGHAAAAVAAAGRPVSPRLPFLALADVGASGLSAAAHQPTRATSGGSPALKSGVGPGSPSSVTFHLPVVGSGRVDAGASTPAAACDAVVVPDQTDEWADAASPLSGHSFASRRAVAAGNAPVIPGTQCEAVCASTAMLPHVPVMTAKEAAAQAATSTSNLLMAGAAVPGVSSRRHRLMGETYQGCTSPFFMLFSASFSSAARPGSRSHRGVHRGEPTLSQPTPTSMQGFDNAGDHNAGSDAGRPASAGTFPSLATSQGWPPVSCRSQVLPALAGAGAGAAALSSSGLNAGSSLVPARRSPAAGTLPGHSAVINGGSQRPRHGTGSGPESHDEPVAGGGGGGAAAASRPPATKGMSSRLVTTFAITAIPREEAKLRPRRLGPLKKEALRRRSQLLTDMATIEKRDQVARQQYVVQHLRLSNAMAYTQSEPMMRRFRAHGRLALERLAGGEMPDAAAQHAGATARANAERANKRNI